VQRHLPKIVKTIELVKKSKLCVPTCRPSLTHPRAPSPGLFLRVLVLVHQNQGQKEKKMGKLPTESGPLRCHQRAASLSFLSTRKVVAVVRTSRSMPVFIKQLVRLFWEYTIANDVSAYARCVATGGQHQTAELLHPACSERRPLHTWRDLSSV